MTFVPTKLLVRFVGNDTLPSTWNEAREIINDSLRSLRSVVDKGFRWREQTTVIDTDIDTGRLPIGIELPDTVKSMPLSIQVLRAVPFRNSEGAVISNPRITWEYRGGRLFILSIEGLSASTRYSLTLAVME